MTDTATRTIFLILIALVVGGMFLFSHLERPNDEANEHENPRLLEHIISIGTINNGFSAFFSEKYQEGLVLHEVFVNPINESQLVIRFIPHSSSSIQTQSRQVKWDLLGSVFFCISVMTTIGYGNHAPTTDRGRFVCLIYAMITLPLFANAIDIAKDFYSNLGLSFEKSIYQCVLKRKPRNKNKIHRRFVLFFLILAVYFIFLLFPSILFVNFEKWTYPDAVYYNFISLSTIGFGDMVAGHNGFYHDNEIISLAYRSFLCFWILLGVPLGSLLMDLWKTQQKDFLQWITKARSSSSLSLDNGQPDKYLHPLGEATVALATQAPQLTK